MKLGDHLYSGDRESLAVHMWRNQQENAQLHLLHDFGHEATKYIAARYDSKAIIKGVLLQRAEMQAAGTLFANGEDGAPHLVGKLDLAALGISAEDIAHIQALKAAQDHARASGEPSQKGFIAEALSRGHGISPAAIAGRDSDEGIGSIFTSPGRR